MTNARQVETINHRVEYGLDWLNKVGNSLNGELYVETFRVNPQDAKAILARSKGFNWRKISRDHVSRLAKMMKDGNWFRNAIPLQFNCDGININGQHRLHAVIEADVSIDFAIAFNADERGIDSGGRPRTRGQSMDHAGADNGRAVASILRLVMGHASGRDMWPENIDAEDFEIVDMFNRDRELANESAKRCHARRKSLVPGSVLGWLHYETARAGLALQCNEFITKLDTGENLSRRDAIYWLRERAINTPRGTKISKMDTIKLLILAWNKFIKNEPCSRLSAAEGPVPKIILTLSSGR